MFGNLKGLTGRDAMRFVGKDAILDAIKEHGQKAVSEALGMANPGVLSAALADLGWRERGTRQSNGDKRSSKIRGCLPVKTGIAVAIVLGREPEDGPDMNWENFKQAVAIKGEDWVNLLIIRLGGHDSEGAASLKTWISSNQEADRLAAEKAAREADPLFQKNAEISALKAEIKVSAQRISELETLLKEAEETARMSSRSGRGVPRGGELTVEMLRLMKQRFHPDKNNGSPEICTAIMAWLNAQG